MLLVRSLSICRQVYKKSKTFDTRVLQHVVPHKKVGHRVTPITTNNIVPRIINNIEKEVNLINNEPFVLKAAQDITLVSIGTGFVTYSFISLGVTCCEYVAEIID